jgi:hypothetical protein
MTASGHLCLLRARTHGVIARLSSPGVVLTLLFAGPTAAQAPPPAPGFELATAFTETTNAAQVRCVLQWAEQDHLVAIGARLFRARAQIAPTRQPLLDLGAGEDIAFLTRMPGGVCAVGSLRSGRVLLVDPDLGLVGRFRGVANAFDAVAVGSDLLVNANPLWPQGGAHAGLWLAGPGRTPREVLPLVGPSAPLAVCGTGDLVVAELGAIVPPPPGAARLLRIPGNRVAAALAGATLSMADVVGIGSGYGGLYDLAVDDQDRVHATDPASSIVVHTDPGGLVPTGTTIDVGAGRFALTLQYLPCGSAPFRGYQPADRAPRLAVASSDFWSSFTWRQLRARRPQASLPGGNPIAAGAFAVDLSGAPPGGIAFAWAGPPVGGNEVVVAELDGTPLWLGLPPAGTFFVAASAIDGAGTASLGMHNPGGTAAAVDLQVIALAAAGTGELGSTPRLHLHLLP